MKYLDSQTCVSKCTLLVDITSVFSGYLYQIRLSCHNMILTRLFNATLIKTLQLTNYNTFTVEKESKEHYQITFSSTLDVITGAVYTVILISSLHAHLHFVVSDERSPQRAELIQRASEQSITHLNVSDWSMHS